jgi:uncharacterized membrane protein
MSWGRRFELSQYLKGSLWVLPLFGAVLGGLLAQAALWVDGAVRLPPEWNYSASTASGVLTAIVGAMVALLGFVVTIGVLVVQQATGTLSPRYMRLWYRDRLQKAVLATFAGTFTFAFALLRSVEDDFVPDIGITVAGVSVASSLGLLLIYLDRFTHRLRPVAVAALVGRSGQEVLEGWTAQLRTYGINERDVLTHLLRQGAVWRVPAERVGAVQAVNLAGLLAAAEADDCVLVLARTVGDFVTPGSVLVEMHGVGPPPSPQLRRLFAFGRERTIEQDPAFALRILVDIAIKALSPAINDPTTAVQVLDHIEGFLEALARTELRERYALCGRDGVIRVVVPGRGWEDYLQLAVTEVREYGATSTQVCRRLRALLEALLETAPAERRPAIRDELGRLAATVETAFLDPSCRALAHRGDRQGIGGRVLPTAPAGSPDRLPARLDGRDGDHRGAQLSQRFVGNPDEAARRAVEVEGD